MHIPPHLPPPSSNIARYYSWQRLKIMLLATGFGLLAGFAGAALVVGFTAPNVVLGTNWIIANRSIPSTPELSSSVVQKLSNTLFTIYSRSSSANGVSYLDSSDRLGDGVVGVSSGWLVVALPHYDGAFKDWRIIGPDSTLYRAQKVLYDKYLSIAYVRLERYTVTPQTTQLQFKVAPFYASLTMPGQVFVYAEGQWIPTTMTRAAVVSPSHFETVPALSAQVVGTFAPGSLVVNNDGGIVGFVRENRVVTPAYAIENSLTGIDDRTAITYATWGVEGWFSEEKPLIIAGKLTDGFFVSKAQPNSLLKRGDVVLTVNDRPATFINVWYTMSEQTSRVVVLRAGKQLSLEITRQRL